MATTKISVDVRVPGVARADQLRRAGREIRENLIELGPTFTKLGQLASTRTDLVPPEIVEELASLRDDVPPMCIEDVYHVLRAADLDVDAAFSEFEPVPIAAASLGQVHRARLRSSGNVVAVKVQRRGLADLVDDDMSLLLSLCSILDRFDDSHTLTLTCEENHRILRNELDYVLEGKHASRFRACFHGKRGVKVPAVLWKYTSRRVLVTEYIPGVDLRDAPDREAMAERLMRLFLHQSVNLGYFHADAHLGNLRFLDDKDQTIVYYDFGMMGELGPDTVADLSSFTVAFYTGDLLGVYECMRRMNMLAATADMSSVAVLVAVFREYLKNGSIGVNDDLLALALDKPLRLPREFVLVLRAFTVTEGVCKSLDPAFDTNAVAEPWGRKLLSRIDFSGEIAKLGESVTQLPVRVARIENFVQSLESGRFKLGVRTSHDVKIASMMAYQRCVVLTTIYMASESVSDSPVFGLFRASLGASALFSAARGFWIGALGK